MGLVRTMAAVLRSLRAAESEVGRLEGVVARWQREAEAKQAALAELKASVGRRVLAGEGSRELAVEAMDLEFAIEGAAAAARVAEEQLAEARDELALAQAAERRQKAEKLTGQADAHQAKVDELLRQLEELDGPRYVLYQPSAEEQKYAAEMNRRLEWTIPKGEVIRGQVAQLLAEAEALEAPVLEKRRAREAASRPLVASAEIRVPAWDDVDSDSHVSCSVSEGAGSATFEVLSVNLPGAREVVTLPDALGRRSWGRKLRIPAGGGTAEVRCSGQVLAKETRPGRLMNDGLARWWVELDPERIKRANR
jgi:hypothetical protein